MKIILLILSVSFCLVLTSLAEFDQEWKEWKETFGKSYGSSEEEERKGVWLNNRKFVERHNKERHSYSVRLNQFGDLTVEEFSKLYLSAFDLSKREEGSTWLSPSNLPSLPDQVDWRTKDIVTPIKNQGQCGSCWSFSATGALEGQHALKTGKLLSLSEQQLVDCSSAYHNQGCNGGWPYQAFKYIQGVGGIETEKEYPYLAHNERCHANSSEFVAQCTGYKDIPSGNEKDLQVATATVGPISVAIDATHASFQFYHKGVYSDSQCSQKDLDHAVLVVGYGTTQGLDYWLVKNSWGTSWGMKGYIMMSRNKDNQCGIATAASYPLV